MVQLLWNGGGEVKEDTGAGKSPRLGWLVSTGAFFFKYRTAAFPLVMTTLFLCFKPVFPRGEVRWDRWLDFLGLIIIFSGQGLRAAVIGYAYITRGGKNRQVYARKLVTGGLFNHSRNPLYVGNILVYCGLFVIHNNPWVYAIGLPFVVFVYACIVATEEVYLRDHFGEEYGDYCRRVNRWFPDFRGVRKSVEDMEFNWRRVVVKEYGATYAWLMATVFLLGYETWRNHIPYDQARPIVNGLTVVFAVATLCWGVVRYLKKSEQLSAKRSTPSTR